MSEPTVFVGDWGFSISLITGIDMTEANAVTARLRRPDNTVIDRTLLAPDIVDRPTGKILFNVEQGDLSHEGYYALQVKAVRTDASDLVSPPVTFLTDWRL